MRPLPEFSNLDRSFWAHVKLVSEALGYSVRPKRGAGPKAPKTLLRYTKDQIAACLASAGLYGDTGAPASLLDKLHAYLNARADVLENQAAAALMNRTQAAAEFTRLRKALNPSCALPMNKQKGAKKHHAYMVGIVNMLTQHALGGRVFDDAPGGLVVVTRDGKPLRTFSRRMDGAYPARTNPHAIWEVKEYYGTTTFGSRVADGVYETMLDGEECAELEAHEGRKVHHYLIVDDKFTWWDKGRSYLCRLVDALHAGLVDEVLFGREVLTRWPEIVKTWP